MLAMAVALIMTYGGDPLPVTYHKTMDDCHTAVELTKKQFAAGDWRSPYPWRHACIPNTIVPGVTATPPLTPTP